MNDVAVHMRTWTGSCWRTSRTGRDVVKWNCWSLVLARCFSFHVRFDPSAAHLTLYHRLSIKKHRALSEQYVRSLVVVHCDPLMILS